MNTKIAIGIPTGGTMAARTALSVIETVRLNPQEFFPIFQHGNFVTTNRQKIVLIAKQFKCSHLFFVDCDMQFKPDVFATLLAHDKDIVGTMYNYRGIIPSKTTTKFFDDTEVPKELFKVAGLGAGCLLIKMSVFEKLEAPYFPMEWNEKGDVVLGEDIGFCEKAREGGFDVWCDPLLEVFHLGEFKY